jgi:hypothetical protein
VVRENNTLHSKIIQVKEEKEEHDIEWRKTQRALLSEKDDLRFLVEQKDSRIKALEQQVMSTHSRSSSSRKTFRSQSKENPSSSLTTQWKLTKKTMPSKWEMTTCGRKNSERLTIEQPSSEKTLAKLNLRRKTSSINSTNAKDKLKLEIRKFQD